MGIIAAIKKDHKEIMSLFEPLTEKKKSDANKEEGLKELLKELVPHIKAEEKVLYPLLMEGEAKDDALEGLEEHHASELMIKDIQKTAVSDERWQAKIKVLKEMVHHHHKDEESKVLKDAASKLDKQKLNSLAEPFDKAKDEARKKIK